MLPEVTVIIPVYQGEKYLAEAIESALVQTGVEFEVLVGDNASTDRSAEIARGFSSPRLRVITREKNLGIFGNLNALVAEARAPLVKILCADDTMMAGAVQAQVEFMHKHPECVFACCRCEGQDAWFAPDGPAHLQGELPEVIKPAAGPLAFATYGNIPGNLTNLIFRREIVLASGGFDQRLPYAGDFEMWSRLAARYPFGIQARELVFVRRHEQQNSNLLNTRGELVLQLDWIYARLFSQVPGKYHGWLRWHMAVVHISQYWNRAVRLATKGVWVALPLAWRARPFSYPRPLPFILFVVTASGHLGRDFGTRRLHRGILELNARAD